MDYLVIAMLCTCFGYLLGSAMATGGLADDLETLARERDDLERRSLELDLKRGWLR